MKFDLSRYFTASAAFLLLTSISLMLPNWMDCEWGGKKLPYVHKGSGLQTAPDARKAEQMVLCAQLKLEQSKREISLSE